MKKQQPPTEYEWLNDVSPLSLLTAADICQIYKLNKKAFFQRIARETFPPHDSVSSVGKYSAQKHYWLASTVKSQVIKDLTE